MSVQEFLDSREIADAALKSYAALLKLSEDSKRPFLEALSAAVRKQTESLLSMNACPVCGNSRTQSQNFCEDCWDANEDYFDALGEIAERVGVGRITPSARCR